ncbi:MAG: substrate-binding domain-containing protein [Phycisphaerae bacterium]|nr:substrate-binding domain-containing protein [Phycisphaerae bacterium]
MSKVTLQNVADKAGLSLSLVSSVLSGGGSNVGFSDVTRRRVLSAARDLKYKRRVADGVGVVHSIGHRDPRRYDWVQDLSPMLSSIHGEARMDNKLVSVFASSAIELDKELTGHKRHRIYQQKNIGGLILSGLMDERLVQLLGEIHLPYVLTNISDAHTHSEDSVCFDDVFAGRLATRYLVNRGHRRVLYVSVAWQFEHYSVSNRLDGYEQVMKEAGLASQIVRLRERPVGFPSEEFVDEIREFLRRPDRPTGIVTYNEVAAMSCQAILREMGLNYDDVEMTTITRQNPRMMKLLRITPVELPAREMGSLAYRMLMEKIETGESRPTISLRGTIRDASEDTN